MSAQTRPRGNPFDNAAREYFATLIRIHGIRGASERSNVRVSKSTLGKIAREFGISLRAGRRLHALIPVPQPQLDSHQVKELSEVLSRGPKEAGYRTKHWTSRQICEIVQRQFAVRCLPHHLKDMFAEQSLGSAETRIIHAAWLRMASASRKSPSPDQSWLKAA